MSNLISASLLIASIGIFFGYLNPTYGALTEKVELKERSILELKEERARYIDALSKTREIELVRTGLLEKYNLISLEDRGRLEKLLPDHIDSVRLIIDVNNIASGYHMSLRNISLTNTEMAQPALTSSTIGPQEEHFKAVGLKFSVSGPYDSFRSFLKDLERSLRLVDMVSVAFTAGETDYDYTVTLSTYRLNTPSPHAS